MLRAWQKPELAQPPLPLYMAKPDPVYPSCWPARRNFKEWQQERQRQRVPPNSILGFQLTKVDVKGPAHGKKLTTEMEA